MIKIFFNDNNTFKFITRDNKEYSIIKRHFTYELQKFQSRNTPIYMQNRINNICLIIDDEYLPLGLLSDFIQLCESNNIEYIIDEQLISQNKISYENIIKFIKKLKPSFKPHSHQIRAIYNAIKYKRIILKSATSSGKSFILYVLSILFNKLCKDNEKILIIVPGIQLVSQLYENFEEYSENNNIDIHKLVKMYHGGTTKVFNKNILISTFHTLHNIKDNKFFEQFKYILIDEVHTGKAKSIQDICFKCINSNYRIGMTGSTFGDRNKEFQLHDATMKGITGPIYHVISARELIEKDLAPDIRIDTYIKDHGEINFDYEIEKVVNSIKNNKKLNNKQKAKKIKTIKNDLYRKELSQLLYNEQRDNFVYNIMKERLDKNALLVFRTVEYGRKLYDDVCQLFPDKKIFYVDGSTNLEDRKELCDTMEKEDNIIGIVSVGTFKQGISIKNLYYLMLCEVGKAPISMIQLIGRAMRKHENKDIAIIIDICDKMYYIDENGNKIKKGYLYKHFLERYEIYKNEKHPIKIFK